MIDATVKAFELRPVKFSRLTRRGVLMGLTAPQLVALGIAILTGVVTLYVWGFEALPWSAPIWLPAALIGLLRFAGRSAAEWVPILANWAIRRATGQTVYRVKLSKPRPAGPKSDSRKKMPGTCMRPMLRRSTKGTSRTTFLWKGGQGAFMCQRSTRKPSFSRSIARGLLL